MDVILEQFDAIANNVGCINRLQEPLVHMFHGFAGRV